MTHIVAISKFDHAFNRAYNVLIMKYEPNSRSDAEKLWRDEYNSIVHYNPSWGQWDAIEFSSQDDFLMFCLRWT